MNKLISVGFFIAGAAVGSIVTWQFLKTKYEEIAQEEIDSVKQTYAKREEKRQFVESNKSSETTGDMTYEKSDQCCTSWCNACHISWRYNASIGRGNRCSNRFCSEKFC